MILFCQRGIALILLFLLTVYSVFAQERQVKFDNGNTMTFEMLKQDPTKPIPFYIGADLGVNISFDLELAAGLSGFYFINPDLMLAGRAAFSTEFSEESNFRNFEIGGYYSFKKTQKVKKEKIVLREERTSFRTTTAYNLKVDEPHQRSWDVYFGLAHLRTPDFEWYAATDLNVAGLDSGSTITLIGQNVTTLEVGISTLEVSRNVFSLDGDLNGQSSYSRFTAKVMVPIVRSGNVIFGATTDVVNERREFVDYFDDQWTFLGVGAYYQLLINPGSFRLNEHYGITIGAALYPFIDPTPFYTATFTIGFGSNDPRQLID